MREIDSAQLARFHNKVRLQLIKCLFSIPIHSNNLVPFCCFQAKSSPQEKAKNVSKDSNIVAPCSGQAAGASAEKGQHKRTHSHTKVMSIGPQASLPHSLHLAAAKSQVCGAHSSAVSSGLCVHPRGAPAECAAASFGKPDVHHDTAQPASVRHSIADNSRHIECCHW